MVLLNYPREEELNDMNEKKCHIELKKNEQILKNHVFKGFVCVKCGLIVDKFIMDEINKLPDTEFIDMN